MSLQVYTLGSPLERGFFPAVLRVYGVLRIHAAVTLFPAVTCMHVPSLHQAIDHVYHGV